MAKKNWIHLKRGLSQDAKHRERMGARIWLYLHILDRAEWETGVVYGWKDKDEAEDMDMPWRTLQRQRQELHDLGYIYCQQTETGQEIEILNWTNPRNYSGEVVNPRGVRKSEYGGTHEGTHEGTQPVTTKVSTPSIQIINHKSEVIKGADAPAKKTKPKAEFMDHPAVCAYRDKFLVTPHVAARRAMAERVDDLVKWAAALDAWLLNRNNPQNVAGLLDSYQNGNRNGNGNYRANGKASRYESGIKHTIAPDSIIPADWKPGQ